MIGVKDTTLGVLRAVFDDTARDASDVVGVGGCLFTEAGAIAFIEDWMRLFPLGCHMRELVSGRGKVFGLMKPETRDRLEVEGAHTLARHASAFAFIACRREDALEANPADGLWMANNFMNEAVMVHMADWCAENTPEDKIQYVFDEGALFKGRLDEHVRSIRGLPDDIRDEWRYDDHYFGRVSNFVLLQAADFVAWEFLRRVVDDEERPAAKVLRTGLRESCAVSFAKREHLLPYFDLKHAEKEELWKWMLENKPSHARRIAKRELGRRKQAVVNAMRRSQRAN